MTEQNVQSEDGPSGLRTLAPLPLPLASGGTGERKKWPWIAGAIVLLTLIGGCVGAVWLVDDAMNSARDASLGPTGLAVIGEGGLESVASSGNGRYAVVQYYRDETYPSVAVWDRRNGESRHLDDYRVLFVEPDAAIIWLEPVSASDAEARTSIDGFGDILDHRPEQLLAWQLDDGSQPTDNVASTWHAWPGSGEMVAYLEIDSLKGAGPSAILFNNRESHGEGVKVKLPADLTTFAPVGWSASGAYFAVEELVDEDAYNKSADSDASLGRRVFVLDAATGEVASDFALPEASAYAPSVAWDGTKDRLLWPDPFVSEGSGDALGFRSATATDTGSHDAFTDLGWKASDGFLGVNEVRLLGWDPAGPVYATDGGIRQLTPDGPVDRGYWEGRGAGAWFPGQGLLSVGYGYGDGPVPQEWVELTRSDIHGGNRETVWQGPKSDANID